MYYATYAVAKRKPEKNSGLYGIRTLDLCYTGAALYQYKLKGSNPVQAWIFLGFKSGGVLPIMACTGRLRKERGYLFQASGPYERVGISLVEMVGKSVISVDIG